MAATFTILGSRPGIAQLGTLDTTNVVFVLMETKPNGVQVEFPVAASVYSASVVHAAAEGWAQIAEGLAGQPFVAGVTSQDDIDANNNLVMVWTITVTSTSGNSEATLSVKNQNIGPGLYADPIADLHAELDATEAL